MLKKKHPIFENCFKKKNISQKFIHPIATPSARETAAFPQGVGLIGRRPGGVSTPSTREI